MEFNRQLTLPSVISLKLIHKNRLIYKESNILVHQTKSKRFNISSHFSKLQQTLSILLQSLILIIRGSKAVITIKGHSTKMVDNRDLISLKLSLLKKLWSLTQQLSEEYQIIWFQSMESNQLMIDCLKVLRSNPLLLTHTFWMLLLYNNFTTLEFKVTRVWQTIEHP